MCRFVRIPVLSSTSQALLLLASEQLVAFQEALLVTELMALAVYSNEVTHDDYGRCVASFVYLFFPLLVKLCCYLRQ
ncbi:hypothetical protein N0O92_11365, partial [Alkalihalobacillus sp. MEB130]|uniref:hypothetical protein n=1 Tax=Alkalihalobacillus sp. MEB130 TaxID=2976704 RepID=UPI0028DF7CE4